MAIIIFLFYFRGLDRTTRTTSRSAPGIFDVCGKRTFAISIWPYVFVNLFKHAKDPEGGLTIEHD